MNFCNEIFSKAATKKEWTTTILVSQIKDNSKIIIRCAPVISLITKPLLITISTLHSSRSAQKGLPRGPLRFKSTWQSPTKLALCQVATHCLAWVPSSALIGAAAHRRITVFHTIFQGHSKVWASPNRAFTNRLLSTSLTNRHNRNSSSV